MPFKIYRSSAGSGKTFTLVKEYLRLSLASDKPDAYRSILAITFTNKAAEEMKSRVLSVLNELAHPKEKPHDMAEPLRKELAIEDNVLQTRAEQVLKHMLHHYADLSISTIDHFTHRLVRTFAQDLELSVNFEVELETGELVNQIITELLAQVGQNDVLTEALLNVVQSQTENEKNWSVVKILRDFSLALFEEETRFHLEELKSVDLSVFNQIRNDVRARIAKNQNRIASAADKALASLQRASIGADKMYYGARGVHGFLSNCASKQFKAPNSYVRTSVEDDKWTSKNADASDISFIDGMKHEIIEAVELTDQLLAQINYLTLIYDNLYGVALLDEMLRIQKNVQQEEEMLHISEFNHLVSNVVMTETAPFIYERIGYRYKHFLVDEFQDTSVLQWFNLLPLVDESLAHNNLCLIVGDAKQSIYRWRGGDVNQFVALPTIYTPTYLEERLGHTPEMLELLKQRQAVLKTNKLIDHLDSNFRSFSNVVEFNNHLFSKLPSTVSSNALDKYEKAAQEITKSEAGLVEIKLLKHPGKKNESWPEYVPLTLLQIEHWVREAIADGFAAGDIAVIVRRNQDAVQIAQYLISKGLNVVSNESLLINSSPKVRLLINLATWLSNPKDTVNVVELVQHLGLVGAEESLTSQRLMTVGLNPETNASQLLNEIYPTTDWNSIRQESLYGQFEKLKHLTLGNDDDTYVNFFFDEVLGYAQTQNQGMLGFLEYWLEKRDKKSIALPENESAIRILSIHKSKGLEFPVVIHPFVDYPTRNSGNNIWSYLDDETLAPLDRIRIRTGSKLENTPFAEANIEEKELRQLDMLNELYVAFTRAKARLYACGKITDSSSVSTAMEHVFQELKNQQPDVEETLVYKLGERDKYDRKKTHTHSWKLSSTGNPNWKSRISISRPSKNKWKMANESDARNLGILIHEALAHIHSEDDIANAVKVLIEDGRISKGESQELQSHIENILSKEELKPLFSKNSTIRNEADIQLSGGDWVRPDRIAYQNEKAWVLDYKTGKEDGKHIKQMQTYKTALIELGFKQVEGMLVYINDEKIVAV